MLRITGYAHLSEVDDNLGIIMKYFFALVNHLSDEGVSRSNFDYSYLSLDDEILDVYLTSRNGFVSIEDLTDAEYSRFLTEHETFVIDRVYERHMEDFRDECWHEQHGYDLPDDYED